MHCPSWDDAFVTGRIAAKRQTAGIKFTHRPKIRFFAQQRLLVAPIQVKLYKWSYTNGEKTVQIDATAQKDLGKFTYCMTFGAHIRTFTLAVSAT